MGTINNITVQILAMGRATGKTNNGFTMKCFNMKRFNMIRLCFKMKYR